MHYPPSFYVTHYHGGIVVYPHVHADGMVSRKLYDRIIRHDREDKDRLTVLNFNDR